MTNIEKIANFKKEAVSALRRAWRMGTLLPETVKKLQKAKMLPGTAQMVKGLNVGTENIRRQHNIGIVTYLGKLRRKPHPEEVYRNMVAKLHLLADVQKKLPKDVRAVLVSAPTALSILPWALLSKRVIKYPAQMRAVANRHEIDEAREFLRLRMNPEARFGASHVSPRVILREAENVGRLSPATQKTFKAFRSQPGMGLSSTQAPKHLESLPEKLRKEIQDAERNITSAEAMKEMGEITAKGRRRPEFAFDKTRAYKVLDELIQKIRRLGFMPTELEQLAKVFPPHKIPGIYRVGS